MKQTLFSIIFLSILVACSAPTDKSNMIHTDSLKKETVITIKLDKFQITDSIVNSIKLKIKSNQLTLKTEKRMDPEGGAVYGYFNPDQNIEYLHSSYVGMVGRNETITYYQGGKIIYSECRFFWFDRDTNGNLANERLIAEKLFYFTDGHFIKDTLTVFNEKLKPPYPEMQFHKSDIPTANQLVSKIIKMEANLKEYGK